MKPQIDIEEYESASWAVKYGTQTFVWAIRVKTPSNEMKAVSNGTYEEAEEKAQEMLSRMEMQRTGQRTYFEPGSAAHTIMEKKRRKAGNTRKMK